MASLTVCDRCGGPVRGSSPNSVATVENENADMAGRFELCVSCSDQLDRWLRPKVFEDLLNMQVWELDAPVDLQRSLFDATR